MNNTNEIQEVKKRIVIYPVNVGDTVYAIQPGLKSFTEAKVKSISCVRYGMYDYFYILCSWNDTSGKEKFLQRIYGINCFKTAEEAEREIIGK